MNWQFDTWTNLIIAIRSCNIIVSQNICLYKLIYFVTMWPRLEASFQQTKRESSTASLGRWRPFGKPFPYNNNGERHKELWKLFHTRLISLPYEDCVWHPLEFSFSDSHGLKWSKITGRNSVLSFNGCLWSRPFN